MDATLKAISDPMRRRLLERLDSEGGQTLQELAAVLPITRQAISKHLAILEGASLVVTLWKGRQKLHYLNPFPLQEVADGWIAKMTRHTREGDVQKQP